MKKRIISIVILIIIIILGFVAVEYHGHLVKERKITERKTMLEDLGMTVNDMSILEDEESLLKALKSIDGITITKLDEENHERIAYGINHMPMLEYIYIYFQYDEIDLDYFSEFDLKDKSLEVRLISCDSQSLKQLGNIGEISNLRIIVGKEIDFSGLDNVLKLEIEDAVINEDSNIGDMVNLEKIEINWTDIYGFGDMSNLKKLQSILLFNSRHSENQMLKSVSGLETLDHEIFFSTNFELEQNIIDELEKVKISLLDIPNSPK